jgi:serpin B
MKSIVYLFFLPAIALFLFTGCGTTDPGEEKPAVIELNKKSLEIIEADQQFAFELFQQVTSLSDQENIMISPLSVSYALGMTFNGADSTTLDAFVDVLHFGELTEQEVNESYQDLMGQLVTLDDRIKLTIANSIWHVDWAVVMEDFIQKNREYFDARIAALDFSDPASVDTINQWIEEKTNGKIKDMLDFIPVDAYMYLVNAIYFKATWKYEFDTGDTYSGTFYKEDDSQATADFMTMETELNFAVTKDFKAVELPYGDGEFSMVAMLPAEGGSVEELAAGLDLEMWQTWYTHASPQEVNVSLPKFKYEFKDSLNDALKNLGLGIAFSDTADFSRITDQVELFISRVIHQTFIDVNEEGTEAAAATIVETRYESAIGNIFMADRPFLYVIKENSTGAIIFMGKVGAPVHD